MWSKIRLLLTRYLWVFSLALLVLFGALGALVEYLYLLLYPNQEDAASTAKFVFYGLVFVSMLLAAWLGGRKITTRSNPRTGSGADKPE